VNKYELHIDGYTLTGGGACPEQYDVRTQSGIHVGYIRLRHGQLTVECPDVGGELVYSPSYGSFPHGDGSFTKGERLHYLRKCIEMIQEWIIDRDFVL
jgi:hypothetical protein